MEDRLLKHYPQQIKAAEKRIAGYEKDLALYDTAGRLAAKAIQINLPRSYVVFDEPPKRGKDINDCLKIELGIKQPRKPERL